MSQDSTSSYPRQTNNFCLTPFPTVSSDPQSHSISRLQSISFHQTTGTVPTSQFYNVSHNTPYPPYEAHPFASGPPSSHLAPSSQRLHHNLSASHLSRVDDGPSGYFGDTTAPVGEDFSRKRKATDGLAESRLATRQRQMVTIDPPGPYASAGEIISNETPDNETLSTSKNTLYISDVGPSSFRSAPIDSSHQSCVSPTKSITKETRQTDTATDLWNFVFGSQQQEEPESLRSMDHKTRFTSKPKTELYPFIGCSICKQDGIWKAWKNSNGCNKHIRRHLINKHKARYVAEVREKGLKNADSVPSTTSMESGKGKAIDGSSMNLPAKAGLEHYLARWVSANGHAIYSMECPEFLGLIQYIDREYMSVKDLPSRARLEGTIAQEASRSRDKLIYNLTHSSGGISITYDTRSDGHFGGFSAVTVHWCAESPAGDLTIHSELATLEYVRGPCSWDTLGKQFQKIFGPTVLKKITTVSREADTFVMDGCICKNTHCDLQGDKHLDCFSRALNFRILDALEKIKLPWTARKFTENRHSSESLDDDSSANSITIVDALCRSQVFVQACQRVQVGLTDQIIPLRELSQALVSHDYENWGSILFVIDRLLEMKSTLSTISKNASDYVKKISLSDREWSTLEDTRELLDIIRQTQLSLDFGHYEAIIHTIQTCYNLRDKLLTLRQKAPLLEECIDHLVQGDFRPWEPNYNNYIFFALIINPTVKFSNFTNERNWDKDDIDLIKESFVSLMMEKHCMAKRYTDSQEPNESHNTTGESESDDQAVVEAELSKYLEAGIEVLTSRFNLLTFWKASKETYPNIYAIVLDCLPMQVNSISIARILWTSEHTYALRGGQISFQTFERLQRLKFSGGNVRLHDTVWGHLETEDAFKSELPAYKCPLDSVLRPLFHSENTPLI
ncbi:hypothetical protein QCA50_002565 [Cerrena zonata]|uniref:Uncharacterized protein n=1 Tax=Cerrena zonata TaxID=2478898 RepID=A0AAW0GI94_9APHY